MNLNHATNKVNGSKLNASEWNNLAADVNELGAGSINENLSNKADKATTLAGYGITDAYTKNEADAIAIAGAAAITGGSTKTIKNVDDYVSTVNEQLDTLKGDSNITIPTINAAIASEVSRATIAEELLQEQYNALTQSDKIIGPLPASGHKDVIYRVPGTNSYSDYMYAHEGDTTPVLMATYNNAIDSVPMPDSENIASSGGTLSKISETTRKVWLRNGSSGNVDNTRVVCSSFIPTNGKHRFKIVITRPNVPGYRYRVGYCLTNSVNDLYKTNDLFHLDGYLYHSDTQADTSLCADHIINFGYNAVGVSCQIDEVSIDDPDVVHPLRVDDFNDYTVSIVDYDDDELYVYTGADTDGLVVEEVLVNVESKSVYIHNGKLIMRSKNNAFGRTFLDNTAFAAELGVSLVTSPTGVQNCIELPSLHCIVLDKADGRYKIKERYEVSDDDVVIMGCSDGKLVYLIDGLATSVLYKHNHDTDERLDVAESEIAALKTINNFTSIFRNGSAGNPNNEKVVTSAFINCTKGSVKINVTRPNTNGYRYLYGYALTSSIEDVGTTRAISQMAGYLSHADSDIESPSCDKDIIDILSNACVGIAIQIREVLIEDYEAYKRGDILAEDVRYNMSFYTSEFKNSFISLEKVNEDDVDVDLTKAEEFNLLFKNAYGDVEPFIFFSDPHYCQTYDDASFIPSAKQNINNILSHYKNTATNFVLCGGDWLTDHKQSIAVKTLAKIDGLMNKTFDKYYPVFGNHDNNYQGELDTTDDRSANDGGLTNQQMVNLWFRKYGKMYYSFNGTSTKFYVFDTGIDWVTEMNEYRWEQVDWFANQLLNNNDSNIVIVMHIISNNGADFANITPMSTNITAVAQAFNNRTSITLNGNTYDFSGKTGKIKCALCGHTHYDYITTLNSIPVYCITTAMDGTFDLVLLDYGANKLRSVRVGSGNNREMNII